jgi:hypothetical protein
MMEEKQKKIALELLEDFNKDSYVVNQGKQQSVEDFDKERSEILNKVKEVIENFFSDNISLEEFKKNIDSLNKQHPYWGFRGINGQMFFNMLYKSSSDKNALKNLLKDVLKSPTNIQDAKNKINKIIEFIKINGTSKKREDDDRVSVQSTESAHQEDDRVQLTPEQVYGEA